MPRTQITVVTPTILGREAELAECKRSVADAGLPHLIGLDVQGEGPAAVRNRLVEQVETEWVVFLDDDDLLYPHYPDVVGKHFHRADLIYTAWDLVGAEEPTPCPLDPFVELTTNLIPVTACVRVPAFRAIGGFDPDALLEDHDLWKRLMLAWDQEQHRPTYRIVYEPTVAWQYRRLAGSRTEEALSVTDGSGGPD